MKDGLDSMRILYEKCITVVTLHWDSWLYFYGDCFKKPVRSFQLFLVAQEVRAH
jgi:hypothetical protein